MNPTYDFGGQVVLVTGGSFGMGLAAARAFAQAGPQWSSLTSTRHTLGTAHRRVQPQNTRCSVFVVMSDDDNVAAMVTAPSTGSAGLEMAFNNAGDDRGRDEGPSG